MSGAGKPFVHRPRHGSLWRREENLNGKVPARALKPAVLSSKTGCVSRGARSPVVEKEIGIGLIETFCFDLQPGECGGGEPGGRILGDIPRSNSGNGDLPQAGFP